MKVLFIGDIVGRLGRKALERDLNNIKEKYSIDITIANVENASGGFGCSVSSYDELLVTGIDYMTSGNHIFDQKDLLRDIDSLDRIIRPLNYPEGTPGRGWMVAEVAGVELVIINALGRVFMQSTDCPFVKTKSLIDELLLKGYKNIILDVHAEATSEKIAIFNYLDGMVSAVLGTHTHVQTADERVSSLGTAYITDVGMTGFCDGILGFDKKPIIEKFVTQIPKRFYSPKSGNSNISAVVIDIDESTGKAVSISRVPS